MMRIAMNADAADWIRPRLHPFAKDVGSIIPEGFAAYARIFHPPGRISEGKVIPVRWREIAAANNRTIAEEMQCLDIAAEPSRFSSAGDELWREQPRTGSIPREIAVRLAGILPGHTGTPELCWFAVWEGFGDVRIRRNAAPILSVPNRDLLLLQGTVADVLTTFSEVDWIYRSPNLWWPDDRAWCVATEIDFTWTYVGGSSACIEAILSDAEIEAVPTITNQGNAMEK
jgi:hypothetical protein